MRRPSRTALAYVTAVADKVRIPEVIEPDAKLPPDLVALRKFARLMDEAFQVPGTKMRFGLDAVLGLIPGVGDVMGALLSTWIIAGALRHRVRPLVILRMIANVAIDLIFGAIPVAGDVFDFLYEENMKNMRLLERYRDRTRPPRRTRDIAFILGLIVFALVCLAFLLLVATVAAILWLIGRRSWF